MARIELDIVALGDFSSVNAQIKALQTQVGLLNKGIAGVGLGGALAKDLGAAQAAFNATMLSTGQFTATTVKMTSETAKFGAALEAGKLKLSQYFNIITGRASAATVSMKALAVEQVKLAESTVMADAARRGVFTVYTPTTINAVTSATKLATMQQNLYNLALEKSSLAMVTWGKNTQWAGRQLMVGLSMPMVIFGAVAVKAFKDANIELTRLQRLYGVGLVAPTDAQISAISDKVMALSKSVAANLGMAQKDTLATAADFAAIGRTGDDLVTSTEQAMRLAKLGSIDQEAAFKGITSIQNTFKVSSKDLAESVNFMAIMQKQTALNLTDITDAFPRIGPIVKQLGGSYRDTAVMMLSMKEAGVPAAQAANALKSAMASLISPTTAAKDMFAKFNINLGGIATSTAGNPVKMIQALQKSLEGIEPLARAQLIEKLFGKFQFARVTAMLDNLGKAGSQTQLAFKLAAASASELKTLVDQEMKIATESTTAKWQRAMESFKVTIYSAGQKFMEVGTLILNFANKIAKAFSHLPSPIKAFLGLMATIATLAGPIIMLSGLMLTFGGYIMKTVVGIRQLVMGGKSFKELLTPEVIASRNAMDLLGSAVGKDVEAVDLLNQAIKQLTASLAEMTAASAVSTGVHSIQSAATNARIAIADSKIGATSKGIQARMTREEAIAMRGSRQEVGTHTLYKPTTIAYLPSAQGIAMNTAMSEGGKGVQAKEYLAAMKMLTGETENAARMFKTSYTAYLDTIVGLTDASGKALITQVDADKILADINIAYEKELVERQRMYELTGQEEYLLKDVNNNLAAIAEKTIMQNAALSSNPAAFQRLFGQFNTSYSNAHPEGSTKGGVRNIPLQDSAYGKTVVPLKTLGGTGAYGLHATNTAFLAAEESKIQHYRNTVIETEKALQAQLAAEIPAREVLGQKLGMAIGEGELAALQAMYPELLKITEMNEEEIAAVKLKIQEASLLQTKAIAEEEKKVRSRSMGMGAGMGISIGAMMLSHPVSQIGGGKNQVASAAGSTLMNVGMGAMMGSFLPAGMLAAVGGLGGLIAMIAALTLAYKGITYLMEKEKEHKQTVSDTFRASSETVKIFGGTFIDITKKVHAYAESPIPVNTMTKLAEQVAAIGKLDAKDPLRKTADAIKSMHSASSVIGTLRQFAAAQVMSGMDPKAVEDMISAMLHYTGQTEYLRQAIKSIVPATKDAETATSTWLDKMVQMGAANIDVAAKYKDLSAAQQVFVEGVYGLATGIIDGAGGIDVMIQKLNALKNSTLSSADAFRALVLAATNANDMPTATEFLRLQSAGLSFAAATVAAAIENSGTSLDQVTSKNGKNVKSPLTSSNAEERIKAGIPLMIAANAQAAKGAALEQVAAVAQADKLKSLEKEKKLIDDKLKALQEQNRLLKEQQDFALKEVDLQQQIKVANSLGDYMKANLLQQQLLSTRIDFAATGAENNLKVQGDAKQKQIDAENTRIAAVAAAKQETAAKNQLTAAQNQIDAAKDPAKLTQMSDALIAALVSVGFKANAGSKSDRTFSINNDINSTSNPKALGKNQLPTAVNTGFENSTNPTETSQPVIGLGRAKLLDTKGVLTQEAKDWIIKNKGIIPEEIITVEGRDYKYHAGKLVLQPLPKPKAQAGFMSPGRYLVGEQGPEILDIPSYGNMIAASGVSSALSKMSFPTPGPSKMISGSYDSAGATIVNNYELGGIHIDRVDSSVDIEKALDDAFRKITIAQKASGSTTKVGNR
jgi:TP901 family phage tail tape measure protein